MLKFYIEKVLIAVADYAENTTYVKKSSGDMLFRHIDVHTYSSRYVGIVAGSTKPVVIVVDVRENVSLLRRPLQLYVELKM